jgi:hypothetical protein
LSFILLRLPATGKANFLLTELTDTVLRDGFLVKERDKTAMANKLSSRRVCFFMAKADLPHKQKDALFSMKKMLRES